ncbi:helix-turn-helix domain-containing protein [Jeotgalicoccus halotolerans]|uniref:helix-turn-helix domain-containing protein n=1 Tax=Jeotgalicoccus halotolerans TaxID=157227 RepID=UPI003511233A
MVEISKLSVEFEKLGIELITGEDNTESKVSYITILELPEKNYNFKPQGLVLSTFQSFKSLKDICEQISWLKKLGILAVGFHKAHYKEVPAAVIKHCKELNMPLFSIPVNVPYHKILDIFNQLENEQLNLKSYEIYKLNDKILESVFMEKDSGYIINLIGNYIKENIILLDPYMKVKAVWKDPAYSQEYMDYLTSRLTSKYKEKLLQSRFFKRDTQLFIDDKKLTLNITPITSKKVFIGYLIFNRNISMNFYNDEVIKMGIKAISMMGSKRSISENHLKLKDIKKFETLIENESNNLKENDFYIPVSKISYCIRVQFLNDEVLKESFNTISTVFMEKSSNVLTWIYNDTQIAYLEEQDDVNEFLEVLSMYNAQAIGLSGKLENISLDDISKMNTQARTAMLSAKDNGKLMASWNDIGIEKVAYNIEELPLLKSLDNELLLPIIEYDRKKDGDLLKTLNSCLTHFFNVKAIAEELFIHPNTVRYRLGQIKELLNIDINESSNFALLVLALKLYEKND